MTPYKARTAEIPCLICINCQIAKYPEDTYSNKVKNKLLLHLMEILYIKQNILNAIGKNNKKDDVEKQEII